MRMDFGAFKGDRTDIFEWEPLRELPEELTRELPKERLYRPAAPG
jgi:hypothetical protein